MRITFLLPVASHARYHKRIAALQSLGVERRVFYFERDYYPGRPWPEGYQSLGSLQHRRYSLRLKMVPKAVLKICSDIQGSDVLYAFSLDTLLIAWLASKTRFKRYKIVYEVGDIREACLGKGLSSRLLRGFERYLLQRIDLLVVTSEAFVTGYFQGIQGLREISYQVIENKLSSLMLPPRQGSDAVCFLDKEDVFRIGYFGLIRCRRSWEALKEIVRKGRGRIRLNVRGIFLEMPDLEEEIQNTEYVEYGGPYVSPDELPNIYRCIDLAWIAHHHGESNTRWARGNRFYEACYFLKPMISQAGTQDDVMVNKMHLGKSINLLDLEGAVEAVLHISGSDIQAWRDSLVRLPDNIFLYTDEHEKLIKSLGKNQN